MNALQQYFMTSPFDTQTVARSLWLIIALPLAGAFICGVFGKALGRANVNLVASATVAGSFGLSLIVLWALNGIDTTMPNPYSVEPVRYALGHDFGTWFQAGAFKVNLGLAADHLSGSMLLVITGVGFLIHLYSTSYMSHDEAYWRFFAYLNLFIAMMLTLVLADSLVLMFVGWEGVGMCSYLLIGFWYDDPAKAFAGRKAFIVNRIGDFGFLLGMFLLVLLVGAFNLQATKTNFGARGVAASSQQVIDQWRTGLSVAGPLNFHGVEEMARALPAHASPDAVSLESKVSFGPLAGYTFGGVLTAIMLLFMLGAAGKSAQLPLYVWLPDAMAGPTPVSALIHAATMVTAGVYMFCRLSYLLALSPTAMAVVALIGACTALLAALIAFSQDDIKKVLAYSTVSQLGFMFMAVGMGVYWAAFLHVVTHAFFKACLFLGAGSVMHGNADETNIKKLGGLKKEMKWTHATFLISTFAITGIIPLSGFFSKDAILHGIHSTTLVAYPWVNKTVWVMGLITAGCTAFYMVRVYWLTFQGKRASHAKVPHAHESDWPMTLPLVILAALAVIFVFQGIPFMPTREGLQTVMENFLSPVFLTTNYVAQTSGFTKVHAAEGLPWAAWVEAWCIALGGGALSLFAYTRFFPNWGPKPVPWVARMARRAAQQKFYVDEVYDFVVVRPLKFLSFVFYKVVDTLLIDTVAVRGTAWVTSQVGAALRYAQTGDVQSYAAVMAMALVGALAYALFQVLQ
jgi:NADH-quinone oxidoreductase subunit L